jgi:mannose-1-phosphate guanylyltransferase
MKIKSNGTDGHLYAGVSDMTAVLLVGGRGERLRSVLPSTPKPLASLGSGSFLELLVRQLRHQEIRHLVMCTGYLAQQIEREFDDGHELDVTIQYSRERQPLGTAGAVRLALRYLKGVRDFLVMNGDSFLEADFHQLIQFHRGHGGLISMAVVPVQNAERYGTVEVDAKNRIIGFREKASRKVPGLVNAGVYVFSPAIFAHLPEEPASLERDVFPRVLDLGVYALEQQGMFIDIGTPEDYVRAQEVSERLYQAAAK